MAPFRHYRGVRSLAFAATMAIAVARVLAHPTPFTYVDLRVQDGRVAVTISAHVIDAAHDLGTAVPETFLSSAPPEATGLVTTLQTRLNLHFDGRPATCGAATFEPLPSTQTVRWSFVCDGEPAAAVGTDGPLFPYDPEHQTFINLYVGGALTAQAVLDEGHRHASLGVRDTQTRLEVVRRFFVAGLEHILAGPDHLLFLAGLLLAGGTIGRLTAIVTAFTIAHSLTLALAVLDLVAPPAALIEPLIALSIVYVGASNLRRPGAADRRAMTAGAFGLIHGFGFAYALREMQLPRGALGWSLFSFNAGVEAGQLAVVLLVAGALAWLRRSGWISPRRLLVTGSIVVAAAGAFWFVERVLALWRG